MPACLKAFTLNVEAALDPQAWWPFEELGTNTDRVDVIQGIHLVTANPTVAVDLAGKVANAVSVTSAGPVAGLTANNSLLLSYEDNGVTIAGWVKPGVGSNFEWDYLASDHVDGTISLNARIIGAQFQANIGASNGGVFSESILLPMPTAGVWHFVAVWYDPADSKLHVQVDNGAISDSVGTFAPPSGLVFGTAQFLENAAATVSFDECAIFQAALTQGQRDILYNGGTGTTWPIV